MKVEKLSRVVVLLLLFFEPSAIGQDILDNISQSDSAYYCSFFPMHIGDRWVYKVDFGDGSGWYYYYEIVTDTVDGLNRHWYGWRYNSRNELKYYSITDSFEVIGGESIIDSAKLIYKLDALSGNKWLINGDLNWGTVYIVDTIYIEGNNTIMKIDEWIWSNNEPTLWLSSRFLRTEIGLYMIWEEGGPTTYLIGAIIDSIVYGNPNEVSKEKLIILSNFHLYQNYPNPFNLNTTIPLYLDNKGTVDFNIYDILGRSIYTKKYYFSEGYNTIIWQGINQNNRPVSSGVYIYELSTSKNKKRMKMILNK